MQICTSHNIQNSHNEKNKRIKYCVYKINNSGKYELVAMTLDLARIESLMGIKLDINLKEVIRNPGDYYFHDIYLIRAEYFKF